MTSADYWLGSILVVVCFLVTWYNKTKVRIATRWFCLWIGAARLGFLTWQGYVHFLGTAAYRLNLGKQEEDWVMVLVLCSAGVIFLTVAPVVWFYREWRDECVASQARRQVT